jgi:saccharopine dehydrogenase-like NADP-dependent oxidoreductase
MGLATVRALLSLPGIEVVLVDRDRERLALAGTGDRLRVHHGDLADDRTGAVLDGCAVVAAALSWADSRPLLARAAHEPMRVVTVGRPPPEHHVTLAPGARLVLGAGLEPGLTEVLARRLAGPGAELRLYCGGVPASPRPPLRHLAWYGTQLTISPRPTYRIAEGALRQVPRFSGLELVDVPGLGVLEAFHDGLAPWIAADRVLGEARQVDQKTLRWPGYAARVTALADLGLLAEAPVPTADGPVRPRALLDAVLAPHITPRPGDTDVTVLVAEAVSPSGDVRSTVVSARTDPTTGTTGMGRLTGGVLAATVRALAGDGAGGLAYPHELFTGPRADALLDDLRAGGAEVTDHPHGWIRRPPTDWR